MTSSKSTFTTVQIILSLVMAIGMPLVWGCSTASVRMMPGEDGNHRVVVRDIEKHDAEEEAIEAANDYCKDQKKRAVFTKDKTEYTGDMDEGTRNTVRQGSKAAVLLGGGSPSQPSVVGDAGRVGYGMTSGKDYKSEIDFKCI